MGARDLPDMYAQSLRATGPQARGLREYISGELQVPMLRTSNMYHFVWADQKEK